MKRKIWENLISWKNKPIRKPLIIRGARQVGKTYIIKKFGQKKYRELHYINFEKDKTAGQIFKKDLNPTRIITELEFYLRKKINKQEDLIFFDEIQNQPLALTSLKYFCEELPNINIISAGSLIGLHLTEISSFPVGKVEFLNLYPMTFFEFLEGIGEIDASEFINNYKIGQRVPDIFHDRFLDLLKYHFIIGGMPEVINLFRDNRDSMFQATNFVRTLQDTLLLSFYADIAKHSGKQNSMHIERVFRSIPTQLAKEQDGAVKRFRFKNIIPGIDRYSRLAGVIDWLLSGDLILKSSIIENISIPLSMNIKPNMMKLYAFDIGLLGSVSDLSPNSILAYDYGSFKGYFAENFIARELVSNYQIPLYSWSKQRSEIEFIIEINGEIIPIEVKSGRITKSSSLLKYRKKYNPKRSILLSLNNYHKTDNTEYYPLYLISKIL